MRSFGRDRAALKGRPYVLPVAHVLKGRPYVLPVAHVLKGRPYVLPVAHVLKGRRYVLVTALVALLAAAPHAQSTQAPDLYKQALALETGLRKDIDATRASTLPVDLLTRMRTLIRTYEDLWKLFPTSPYSDNALWQGAMLSADAFRQSGEATDRATATRMFQALTKNFPTSSLVKQVPVQLKRLQETVPATTLTQQSTLTGIRREVLPDALRVTLELEREPVFFAERIDGPPRVFVDLQNTRTSTALADASLPFKDDVVKQIRVGRQLNGRTRVVLDLSVGAGRYSVYSLYNPYRIVIDFERKPPTPPTPQAATKTADAEVRPTVAVPATPPPVSAAAPPPASPRTAPVPPAANSTGSFSLSRQLGLGVARIVIDPGHGGHDPGAKVKGLTEAELTLDIALRLEKLLVAKQPGVEVVLTRRADAYVQLEERTAMANRVGADLFLSIHANASDAAAARGIETYFLNFAANPEAEAVAARENADSSKTMRNLPDIVKAIATNNKIDESRDFAAMVQASMYEKLRPVNKDLRNLGVKQAPFMVLIGATMPSVLAEISFMTNRQEGALLKTEKYRQQIAEALYQGVMRYQQSLKKAPAIAMDTAGLPRPDSPGRP
jgi:N-acetylmuramoyl-L-alanine amidase